MPNNDPKLHVIALRTNGGRLRGGEITIDGRPIKAVRAVTIEATVEYATIVKIELLANIDYEGQTDAIDMRKLNGGEANA